MFLAAKLGPHGPSVEVFPAAAAVPPCTAPARPSTGETIFARAVACACHSLGGRPAPPDKSLAFLLPPLGLYCFPRKLRRAIWAGLCAGRGVRPSATAVYLCCLLCATAPLTLSSECNCFSTATTAARQVCSKHPLIKSLFAESLIAVLVNRRTATSALVPLLSDTCVPRLSLPALRNGTPSAATKSLPPWAGVRLRLLQQAQPLVRGLFSGGACQIDMHVCVVPMIMSNSMHHVLQV